MYTLETIEKISKKKIKNVLQNEPTSISLYTLRNNFKYFSFLFFSYVI